MNTIKTTLALAALSLAAAAGSAQAARLQLVSGSSSGSVTTAVSGGAGDSVQLDGSTVDLSGTAELLGFGAGSDTGALAGGSVQVSQDWSQLAVLDASGATTTFQMDLSHSLSVSGPATVGISHSSTANLSGELLVASDGEAAGQNVVVRLQLGADSLGASDFAGTSTSGGFTLEVRDSASQLLASYTGPLAGSSDTLDLSFASAVGQTLLFSMQWNGMADVALAATPLATSTLASSHLMGGSLAVTAVPEPQSALLLLAGLGLVAVRAARRQVRH